MTASAPAGSTVLPPQAPPPVWWRLPAERPSWWVLALRAAACAALGAAVAQAALPLLGFAAIVLLPTCASTESPALQAFAATFLVLSVCLPVVAAGRRLWWVGLPVGLLTLHATWRTAGDLLTGPQSGFCF